jgi:hypothetical protein
MSRTSNKMSDAAVAKATAAEYAKLAGKMQVAVDWFIEHSPSGDPVNDPGPNAWSGVKACGRHWSYISAAEHLDNLRRQARHYAGIAARLLNSH